MEEGNGQNVKNYIKGFAKRSAKVIAKIILRGPISKIIVGVVLLVVLLASFTYVKRKDDGVFKEGDEKNVPYVAGKTMIDNIGGNNITSVNEQYTLGSDLDSIVDQIITKLKNNGGRLDEYIDESNQKKYIKCFIQAEIATLYPDISGRTPEESKEIIKNDDYNDLQGRIYIYRRNENGDEELMKYLPVSEFNNKVSANDANIKQYYTLNENNELLVASVSYSTDNDGNRTATVSVGSPISYQEQLKNYSMPFDYLWALLVMSDDQDFVYKLAQMGRDSEIKITVYDNWTKTTNITEDITNITTQTITQNWRKTQYGEERYGNDQTSSNTSDNIVTTTTVSENNTISVDITYADTWIAKYENAYYRMKQAPITTENTNELDDFDNNNTLIDSYETGKNNKKEYQKVYKYEQINSHKICCSYTVESVEYRENESKVQEKTDTDKDTPDNFVKMLTRYKKAKSNLFSCELWLFDVLEDNEKTESLLDITKYLFYKVSDKSYGVTEFKDIYNDIEFKEFGASGGSISPFGITLTREEFISMAKSYQGGSYYISNMANYAGDFYDVCKEYNINPAYTYAHACLETGYGSSEICINKKNYFGMNAYNTNISAATSYSSPADSVRDYCKWVVEHSTSGTSAYNADYARGQEFATVNTIFNGKPDNNIYVLFSRYAVLDAHHGDSWGGDWFTREVQGIPCAHSIGSATTLKEFADYSEYTTNKRIEIAKKIFGSKAFPSIEGTSSNIVQIAQDMMQYMINNKYAYVQGNSVPLENNPKQVDCSSFICWVLYRAGYTDAQNNGWQLSCTTLLPYCQKKGWKRIDSYNDLQPGDIVFCRSRWRSINTCSNVCWI